MLGGGFVPGSALLLIGPPGAGKSTLVMQVLSAMGLPSLYVSGEESVQQLKLRAERLHINSPGIYLLFETNVNRIARLIGEARRLGAVVIDSIQTVYTDASDALPGSLTQVRKCSYILRRLAQNRNLILMIVGQVTKDNRAAGPRILEHAVDVVLSIEVQESPPYGRILVPLKNRFGSTQHRCRLTMGDAGIAFQKGDR
jgi:DNA repair protein RadA/Sms